MKRFKIVVFVFSIFLSCQENTLHTETKERAQSYQEGTVTIYTIGDSTMADKPDPEQNPERGWGQLLPTFLNHKVTVENHAMNGRSTRSFIKGNNWQAVHNKLKKGDYVFIQFGHNDQKKADPKRYTNPHTAYRYNLIRFVKETREKGATPVLFTSIVRRKWNTEGTLIDAHDVYPLEARLVSMEYDVPFIDLQYLTEQLEESYGPEESKELHLHLAPGDHLFYPDGMEDNTHLSIRGATEIAGLAVQALTVEIVDFDRFVRE